MSWWPLQFPLDLVAKTDKNQTFPSYRPEQKYLYIPNQKNMHYATLKTLDTANGPWLRVSLFVSGCHHACPGCFNAEAWNFQFGQEFSQATIDEIIKNLKPDHIAGLTLLGGEPLAPENQPEVRNLISQVRQILPEKTIWCYTGFTYEFLTQHMAKQLPYTQQILQNVDVVIDGRFEQELLDLKLQFRGSRNQRVIDIQATRQSSQIIWSNAIDDQDLYLFKPSPEKKIFAAFLADIQIRDQKNALD